MTTEKKQIELTAIEWFQKLKEPYRSQAIKASDETVRISRIEKLYPSLSEAILTEFIWHNTPQGWLYWDKVHTSIERGETTYLAEDNDTPSKEQLIEVLKELVKLKTLKDEAGEYPEYLVIDNYRERKNAAWKKAKELLNKLPEPPQP